MTAKQYFIGSIIGTLFILFVLLIIFKTCDDNPAVQVRDNVDTGKAYLGHDVSFIEGGQEVIRVTIKPFKCPHCGKEINLMTGTNE